MYRYPDGDVQSKPYIFFLFFLIAYPPLRHIVVLFVQGRPSQTTLSVLGGAGAGNFLFSDRVSVCVCVFPRPS